MTDEWQWDDESIPDDQLIFRFGNPDVPDHVDLLSSKPTLLAASMSAKEYDGWSVYREQLMRDRNLDIVDIENSGRGGRKVFQMTVGEARKNNDTYAAGVVDKVDEEDPVLGECHSLIRVPKDQMTPSQMRGLRLVLLGLLAPAVPLAS
ncbi:hypothetical protein [Amycolatopsis sp. NPDC003861]